MTKTLQLIRQAIRELHIDIEPHNREVEITPDTEKAGTYKVTTTNRAGNPMELNINMDADYNIILVQLRDAWKAK
jgi:hypothetical protein